MAPLLTMLCHLWVKTSKSTTQTPNLAVVAENRFPFKMQTAPLKIASWNVNSIKARLPHVQEWLESNKPNILFLQELKGETLPDISDKYQAVFVGQKAYNGVAILSDTPVTIIQTRLAGDDTDQQARYLEVDYKGLRLINIYLPNGNPVDSEKFPYKLAWMERLYLRLKTLREQKIPFLIGGDFNVIPEDKDCYDPAAWQNDALFHPETLRQYRKLIGLGLTDALRVFNKNEGVYTFWDYQAGAWPRNHGIRIDHFLLSPEITDRLIDCQIDKTPRAQERASDHTPIIMTLAHAPF